MFALTPVLLALCCGDADADRTPVFTQGSLQVRRTTYQGKADERFHNKPHHYLMRADVHRGLQFLKPANRQHWGDPALDPVRLPTTYYHRASPVGIALTKADWFPGPENTYRADARLPASLTASLAAPLGAALPMTALVDLWSEPPIAVVGMEVGTLAAYARPFQTMHFFESDPTVVALSQPAKQATAPHFTYIAEAQQRGANVDTYVGPERATLVKHAGKGFYHFLVVEICPRDRLEDVNVPLLTKEGMHACMELLTEEGVLCIHISNRYLDLVPVIAGNAEGMQLAWRVGSDRVSERGLGTFSSEWLVLARQERTLSQLQEPADFKLKARDRFDSRPYWHREVEAPTQTWTDAGPRSLKGVLRTDPRALRTFDGCMDGVERMLLGKNPDRNSPLARMLSDVRSSVGFRLTSLGGALGDTHEQTTDDLQSGSPLRDLVITAWQIRQAVSLPRLMPTHDDGVIFAKDNIAVKRHQDAQAKLPEVRGPLSYVTLVRGAINFGQQYQRPAHKEANPDYSRLPTTYYHPESPIGLALSKLNWFPGPFHTYYADARLPASLTALLSPSPGALLPTTALVGLWSEPPIAVVGLSIGTLAAYARPLQTLDFYEREPLIVELSQRSKGRPPHFTYVEDARARGAHINLIPGEERPTLTERGPRGYYHLLSVELCTRDHEEAICYELVTREGLAACMALLADGGVLALHTSHRYLDMPPVIAAACRELGLTCRRGHDMAGSDTGGFSSEWVFVARRPEDLAHLREPPTYQQRAQLRFGAAEPYWSTPDNKGSSWTDKGPNYLRGVLRSDPAAARLGALYAHAHDKLVSLVTVHGGHGWRVGDAIAQALSPALVSWRLQQKQRIEDLRH